MSNNFKEAKEPQIKFVIASVTTEQFAIIKETFDDSKEVAIDNQMVFNIDFEGRMIAVFGEFTFQQNGETLLRLVVGCHFLIANDSWQHLKPNQDNQSIFLPKAIATHLCMITVGTARGVLHARTSQTDYNIIVLPPVDLTTIIKDETEIRETSAKP